VVRLRQSSQRPLAVLDYVHLRVTQKIFYFKKQNYGSHILKRINIQAFKLVPVERLHLKMGMNHLFEYSYGKPVGTAIKDSFFLGTFIFVLI
jgi:hypothetical protein